LICELENDELTDLIALFRELPSDDPPKCELEIDELWVPMELARELLSEFPPKCELAMFDSARFGEIADPVP
jgi:hypothetical protein